ncbi:Mobile element protein [Richelia intracellularis]|nr:Mobile element protein [Richelia intracellularis]
MQPLLVFWFIYLWIYIFSNSHLLLGLNNLIAAMKKLKSCYISGLFRF